MAIFTIKAFGERWLRDLYEDAFLEKVDLTKKARLDSNLTVGF